MIDRKASQLTTRRYRYANFANYNRQSEWSHDLFNSDPYWLTKISLCDLPIIPDYADIRAILKYEDPDQNFNSGSGISVVINFLDLDVIKALLTSLF